MCIACIYWSPCANIVVVDWNAPDNWYCHLIGPYQILVMSPMWVYYYTDVSGPSHLTCEGLVHETMVNVSYGYPQSLGWQLFWL